MTAAGVPGGVLELRFTHTDRAVEASTDAAGVRTGHSECVPTVSEPRAMHLPAAKESRPARPHNEAARGGIGAG